MIRFCYNPTSWDFDADALVPGGMADCLVQPILPHLEVASEIGYLPKERHTNVYYAHRAKYTAKDANGRRHAVPRPFGERAVFVSHGVADKMWRQGHRLTKGHFDYVFVSGPAWTERMQVTGFSGEIVEVGYAKLDPLFSGEVAPLRPHDGRIRVVWAPTHGGGGEPYRNATESPGTPGSRCSTWWDRAEILQLLPKSEFDVIEAPHPRHRPDGKSTLAEYVDADVVIADGGSTIYEAWALDLPVVFPDWLVGMANVSRYVGSMESQVYREQIGCHVGDPTRFAEAVAGAAERGITPAEQAYIEPIIPRRHRGVSGRMHAEALCDIDYRVQVRHGRSPSKTLTGVDRLRLRRRQERLLREGVMTDGL